MYNPNDTINVKRNEKTSHAHRCTCSWYISSLYGSSVGMAKLKYITEIEKINRCFMDEEISFNEYKEKANAILLDTPEELKLKVANAALFVSLTIH